MLSDDQAQKSLCNEEKIEAELLESLRKLSDMSDTGRVHENRLSEILLSKYPNLGAFDAEHVTVQMLDRMSEKGLCYQTEEGLWVPVGETGWTDRSCKSFESKDEATPALDKPTGSWTRNSKSGGGPHLDKVPLTESSDVWFGHEKKMHSTPKRVVITDTSKNISIQQKRRSTKMSPGAKSPSECKDGPPSGKKEGGTPASQKMAGKSTEKSPNVGLDSKYSFKGNITLKLCNNNLRQNYKIVCVGNGTLTKLA